MDNLDSEIAMSEFDGFDVGDPGHSEVELEGYNIVKSFEETFLALGIEFIAQTMDPYVMEQIHEYYVNRMLKDAER